MTGTLGKRIGASLSGGEILALTGELGAGKTVFVKGLSIGLEIDDVITSPTYVPGTEKVGCCHRQVRYGGGVHQPAS